MNAVCYIPMLEGQVLDVQEWLEKAGTRFGVLPVLLPPTDWNNDLTPWPAGPIFKKGKAFGGHAEAYLHKLENELIPGIETTLGVVPEERWILGVSLAGLFAVWAAARSNSFSRIAAISGSFWFPDFSQWLQTQTFSPSLKAAYLSLGCKEAESRNPHLKDIATRTREVAGILSGKGIPTTFEWTEGTHFAPVIPRLELALQHLAAGAVR